MNGGRLLISVNLKDVIPREVIVCTVFTRSLSSRRVSGLYVK
jgi:hypothetical protein